MATTYHEIEHKVMPEVRVVSTDAPMRWLKAGIEDMKKSPAASLLYGLIFTVLGAVMMFAVMAKPIFVISLITGFLLVGPFVAVGLYDLSRRIEAGEKPTLAHAFGALRRNSLGLALFAVILGLIMVFWTRSAAIMTAIFFNDVTLATEGWAALFTSEQSLPFLLSFIGFGGLLAIVAFSISVVSIPMLIDRKTDVITAVVTSLKAVVKNPLTMAAWAFMIAFVIALGVLALYVGLIIALPIIGHASWHAYKDIVK